MCRVNEAASFFCLLFFGFILLLTIGGLQENEHYKVGLTGKICIYSFIVIIIICMFLIVFRVVMYRIFPPDPNRKIYYDDLGSHSLEDTSECC